MKTRVFVERDGSGWKCWAMRDGKRVEIGRHRDLETLVKRITAYGFRVVMLR